MISTVNRVGKEEEGRRDNLFVKRKIVRWTGKETRENRTKQNKNKCTRQPARRPCYAKKNANKTRVKRSEEKKEKKVIEIVGLQE